MYWNGCERRRSRPNATRKQDQETRQSGQLVPNLEAAVSSHVKLRSLADNYQSFKVITLIFIISSARISNLSHA
jgi:hypothetical protein